MSLTLNGAAVMLMASPRRELASAPSALPLTGAYLAWLPRIRYKCIQLELDPAAIEPNFPSPVAFGSAWGRGSNRGHGREVHRSHLRPRRGVAYTVAPSALTGGFQGGLQIRDAEIDIDPTRAPSRARVGVPNVDAGLAQLLGNPT
jgi:hypothetical protein